MSDIKISREKLLDGSDKWADLPAKSNSKNEINTRIDAIRILEVAIRSMLQKGYTYKDVTEKLFEDFQIEITPQTLSSYLATIKKEYKKSLLLSKREAAKLAKISQPEQVEISKDEQVEINVEKSDDVSISSTEKSSKDNFSTDPITSKNTSSNLKADKPTDKNSSKSIVPKVVSAENSQAEDGDEAERLREEKMDKFYNKY